MVPRLVDCQALPCVEGAGHWAWAWVLKQLAAETLGALELLLAHWNVARIGSEIPGSSVHLLVGWVGS